MLSIALLLFCLTLKNKFTFGIIEEDRLLDKLFDGYDQRVRPVRHHNHVLNVTFTMELYQLLEISEREEYIKIKATITQHWYDFRLKWNASEYDGLRELHIPANQPYKTEESSKLI